MGLALYEIDSTLQFLLDQAENFAIENEGLLPDELETQIEKLEMEKNKKVSNIARWYKNLQSEEKAVRGEAKNLQDRANSLKKKLDWIKRCLTISIGEGNKWSDEVTKISFRKSQAVLIENEDDIPDDYCEFEKKIKKSLIKQFIQDGGKVPGAHIEENSNIQIK